MKKELIQQALVETKFEKQKGSSDLCEALDVVKIVLRRIREGTSSWSFIARHAIGFVIGILDRAIAEECDAGPGYDNPFDRR